MRFGFVVLALTWSMSADADAPEQGYILHCMGCHLEQGQGREPNVPRLKDRVGYYLALPGGRDYLLQVPGASQSLLSDKALARTTNWLVTAFAGQSMPDEFEPYTESEVTRLRHNGPVDIDAVRIRLNLQVDLLEAEHDDE
jgi:hypothetical protein